MLCAKTGTQQERRNSRQEKMAPRRYSEYGRRSLARFNWTLPAEKANHQESTVGTRRDMGSGVPSMLVLMEYSARLRRKRTESPQSRLAESTS